MDDPVYVLTIKEKAFSCSSAFGDFLKHCWTFATPQEKTVDMVDWCENKRVKILIDPAADLKLYSRPRLI